MKQSFWRRKVAGFILVALAAILLLSFVVMSLWNGVLVKVVPVSPVSFGQALGIFVLSKILFSGFKGRGWGNRGRWSQQLKDKWQMMTPEEQQKFKQDWRNRCSRWSTRPETQAQTTTGSSEL
ncbi:hypothetical protein EXU57_12100 [Segetibacter sp. 3557_3]|uniref:hypothetical protein n=1 Tax=Segetibacter sp. 3557_3 TaxID=2547429 RepID=UPI0010588615|nr:hypothetical protein [Segetibacter sp. 3557_3]TDH26224.1 hypothetical protein EXU57_12100 [Segetibacter sp. 3557_3]